ncbi:MFS transporter [Allorhizocola rhizosphaerae]|uniref:MFS transporter n=1 Tax=Allorhizocola rhizosphaerae TaxID=1872709 RepID=UPI000E3D4ED4|nr:MFS transporter [Allorhizocola rhizosphaerae]
MTSTEVRPTRSRKKAAPPAEAPSEAKVAKADGGDASAPDPRRWAALVIMLASVFMDMLDASIVNVAIPTIQRDIGASYGAIQWITAGYVLAFALLLITGGRLGDIYGRRRMFQLGVVGFTLASLVCGIAADPGTLIVARLVQGAFAGLMVPQVISIIHVAFANEEKGKAFALHGMIGGVAATIAPLIGGVIVAANIFGWDWRPIFLINVPIGLIGFLLGMKFIPESKAPSAVRLDIPGVIIASAAMLLLLYPLTFGRELGWPAWTYAAMVFAAVVLTWFVAYERYKQNKDGSSLIALDLFKARSFTSAQILQLAFYTFTGMFFLALYLFMQLGLGWSPLRAGLTVLAFCIGAFITATASVVALVPKFGRTVLQFGALVVAIGLAVFLWTNGTKGWETTSWSLVPALFLIGLGFGATATPIPIFGLADVPFKDAGSASGLITTMQQLGFAVGIAIVSLSFFTPLAPSAVKSVDQLTPQLRQELVAVGVPSGRIDALTASFRDCTIERFSATSPTESASGCVEAAARQDPQAGEVLTKFAQRAGAQTFSGSLQVALYTALGLMVVIFLLVGGLPKRAQGAGPA